MSCSTEEADNYYINGKEEYPSFFSFFLFISVHSIPEIGRPLKRTKVELFVQLFRMVWKVGKAVIGEDALHTVAGDERGVGLVRARIAHVHGRHESEPGTRRRERSRNAGRRLGVCAVNGARRGGNGGVSSSLDSHLD